MKKAAYSIVSFLVVLFIAVSCSRIPTRSTNYSYQRLQIHDGVPTDELNKVGMDSNLITRLTNLILADSFPNVHSLLIAKDGKLVHEAYFAGKDQRHGKSLGYIEHSWDQLHDCRSISKSVVSACIGIAIQQGLIASENDPVSKYLTEIKDSVKSTITIKDLLTMTAGLDWKEIGHYGSFFNSETQMDIRFNPVKYVLKKPVTTTPGSMWNYSAGNTQLLAEIIHRTSGLTVDKFAERYLFSPLGIKSYEWVTLFFKNIPAAASGLRLTSRDLLKFGLLYMNSGRYNSLQVIDSVWIKQSFQSYVQRPSLTDLKINEGGYGYAFWTYTDTIDGKRSEIIEAKGNGGQSIFFCKSLNLLVVTTGGNFNQPDDNPYRMLTKYIIPSVVSH